MKKPTVILLCGMTFVACAALPAAINDPKDEKSVMATLDAMAQATIKKDVAALDKIYHPDLTYSHSSAMNQTKAEVLKAVAGPGVTESMTFHETTICIYGNTALVRGRNELRNGAPGNMPNAILHYNYDYDYVDAVEFFARAYRADAHWLDRMYYWNTTG